MMLALASSSSNSSNLTSASRPSSQTWRPKLQTRAPSSTNTSATETRPNSSSASASASASRSHLSTPRKHTQPSSSRPARSASRNSPDITSNSPVQANRRAANLNQASSSVTNDADSINPKNTPVTPVQTSTPPPSPPVLNIVNYPTTELLKLLAALLVQIAAANDAMRDSTPLPSSSPTSPNEQPRSPVSPRGASHDNGSGSGSGETSASHLTGVHSRVTPALFHARNIPTISVESYLLRILKYCPTTNEVFLSLLVYFDRMSKNLQEGRPGIAIDSFNVHRLVIAGITVASKFFSDVFYLNSRYAKVGGLPQAELNQLELQFLVLNDFHLLISPEELQRYANSLLAYKDTLSVKSGVKSPVSPRSNASTRSTDAGAGSRRTTSVASIGSSSKASKTSTGKAKLAISSSSSSSSSDIAEEEEDVADVGALPGGNFGGRSPMGASASSKANFQALPTPDPSPQTNHIDAHTKGLVPNPGLNTKMPEQTFSTPPPGTLQQTTNPTATLIPSPSSYANPRPTSLSGLFSQANIYNSSFPMPTPVPTRAGTANSASSSSMPRFTAQPSYGPTYGASIEAPNPYPELGASSSAPFVHPSFTPSHSRYPSTSTTNSIFSTAASASSHSHSQLNTEESSGYGSTTDDEPTIKPDHSSGSSIHTVSSVSSDATTEGEDGEAIRRRLIDGGNDDGEGTPAGSPVFGASTASGGAARPRIGRLGIGRAYDPSAVGFGFGGLGTASSSSTSLSSASMYPQTSTSSTGPGGLFQPLFGGVGSSSQSQAPLGTSIPLSTSTSSLISGPGIFGRLTAAEEDADTDGEGDVGDGDEADYDFVDEDEAKDDDDVDTDDERRLFGSNALMKGAKSSFAKMIPSSASSRGGAGRTKRRRTRTMRIRNPAQLQTSAPLPPHQQQSALFAKSSRSKTPDSSHRPSQTLQVTPPPPPRSSSTNNHTNTSTTPSRRRSPPSASEDNDPREWGRHVQRQRRGSGPLNLFKRASESPLQASGAVRMDTD